MDLSHVSYNISVPKPLILLLQAVDFVFCSVSLVLYYVGLLPSFQDSPTPWNDISYACPSSSSPLIPTTVLKRELRVVEYEKSRKKSHEPFCAVCLNGLKEEDKVRELANCEHVFHKDCIDEWIDMGKVTCPLCRAELLSVKGKGCRGGIVSLMEGFWRI